MAAIESSKPERTIGKTLVNFIARLLKIEKIMNAANALRRVMLVRNCAGKEFQA
jgi:hypothetical protein